MENPRVRLQDRFAETKRVTCRRQSTKLDLSRDMTKPTE